MDFTTYANQCEETQQPLNGATLEHFEVPFCLGGAWSMDNMKLSCRGCNQRHGRALQRQRAAEANIMRSRLHKGVLLTAWPALVEVGL